MPRTWAEAKHVIEDIEVHNCSIQQIEWLYQRSRETTGKIVEVGTNVGMSTIALAQGQLERSGHPIASVDIFKHRDIDDNLRRADVADYVDLRIGNSASIAATWSEPIDLLFLDGDHSYRGTAADIRGWSRFVAPGGMLALHDYPGHRGSTEVWRAAYDLLLSDPLRWRVVDDRVVGSLMVFQRLRDEATANARHDYLYWRYRDARALFFSTFPRLSSRIVSRIKK